MIAKQLKKALVRAFEKREMVRLGTEIYITVAPCDEMRDAIIFSWHRYTITSYIGKLTISDTECLNVDIYGAIAQELEELLFQHISLLFAKGLEHELELIEGYVVKYAEDAYVSVTGEGYEHKNELHYEGTIEDALCSFPEIEEKKNEKPF